ncbi:hypothetical protein Q7P36_007130 [Cladosporium allicinum]
MSSALCLQSLPPDILAMLPEFLYNIEDYTNLSSTCRIMRVTMATATPKQILRLAAAQSNVFFRPDPLFLVAATARELGNWARSSWDNEWEFIDGLEGVGGFEKILDLALKHCGLTLERIRELHLLRFSLINPAIEIIDKCVGEQWRATQDFWNSSASDAWSINAEPAETLSTSSSTANSSARTSRLSWTRPQERRSRRSAHAWMSRGGVWIMIMNSL